MGQSNVFRASKVMLPLSNAMGYDKMIIILPTRRGALRAPAERLHQRSNIGTTMERYDFEQYANELLSAFRSHGDAWALLCLRDDGSVWRLSFKTLVRYIEDFAQWKQRLGLVDGSRVLIVAQTTVDALLTFLIVSLNHLTAVMADPAVPMEELEPLLHQCRISAVFTDRKSEEAVKPLPLGPICRVYGMDSHMGVVEARPLNADAGMPTPLSPVIMFSSGSTARRKCVEVSYASMLITHRKVNQLVDTHPPKKTQPIFEVFPMSHVSGLFSAYTLLNEGVTVACVETLNTDTLKKGLKHFKPHAFGMVPRVNDLFVNTLEEALKKKHLFGLYSKLSALSRKAMVRTRNLKASRRLMLPFRSLLYNRNFTCLFSGGTAGTPHTSEALENMGVAYLDLYSSTECGVFIACTDPSDPFDTGSVGNVKRDPWTEVCIHEPDEQGTGEIYVKTRQIMNGYFGDEEATRNAFDGGWFKTGDLGHIDDRGYLYVTGRCKESIQMANGAKVAPSDLERLLAPVMPEDVEYAVVGVPFAGDGMDRIHLFIQHISFSESQREQLREKISAFQRKKLSQYRIQTIHFIDKLPKTNIGKIRRYLLKERALREDAATEKREAVPEIAERAEATAKAHTREEAREIVFEAVRRVLDLEGPLTGQERLKDDLGLDSLGMMELSMALEAEFGALPSDVLGSIPNLDALADYCAANQGSAKPRRHETDLDVSRYPVRRRWYHRALFKTAKRWCLTSLDFRVEGLENLVPGRQYIFCPNHAANFDGLFVLAALDRTGIDLNRFGSLSKQELARNPFTALITNTAGSIPVDRFGDTLPSVHRAIDFIREGGSLMIFPEGTRTRDGSLGRFHEGAAYIALSSGMTIIPTAIIGSYKVFPHTQKLPQVRDRTTGQRYRVTVCFCPEVETAGRSEREITEAVRRAIEERLGKA